MEMYEAIVSATTFEFALSASLAIAALLMVALVVLEGVRMVMGMLK